MTEHNNKLRMHLNHTYIRKQRIEHWISKDRNITMNDKLIRLSTCFESSLTQKQLNNSLFQSNHDLNKYLFQLGEQREKLIEQCNFNQKLFANKQSLCHKNNQSLLTTLNYVENCCKYSNMNNKKITSSQSLVPTVSKVKQHLSNNNNIKTNTSSIDTILKNKKKPIESSKQLPSTIQSNEKHHTKFPINTKQGSQSAHLSNRSNLLTDNKQPIRNAKSACELRTYEIYPKTTTTVDYRKKQIKSSSKLKRKFSTKSSVQEFRHYPEKYLSKTNRYLPLLHEQAMKIKSHEFYLKQQKEKNNLLKKHHKQFSSTISHSSDQSDIIYDDAKSFLSEDIETRKMALNSHVPISNKNTNEINSKYSMILSHYRNREYAHLHKLIHTNSIEHILEPFSSINNQQQQSICLNNILNSNDSLHNYSTIKNDHIQKKINIEKNLSKLDILIF